MAEYHLQIVTPDRMVYDGQAQRLIVRTVGGDVCILAHFAMLTMLYVATAQPEDA